MTKKSSTDDLLNEIMQRRRANQVSAQTDPFARIFDNLNVMDTLDGLRLHATLCYGPKVIKSALPSMGVVIWQRATGYHGYKTLRLVGVWAYQRGDRPIIGIGAKTLAFAAPFYDADAYHKIIRKTYDLYYKDDNKPPSQPSYSFTYDMELRLEQRQLVAHETAKLLS